jgi:hypothetical protein
VDAIGQRALPGVRRFRKLLPNNVLLAVGDTEAGRAFLEVAVYPPRRRPAFLFAGSGNQ